MTDQTRTTQDSIDGEPDADRVDADLWPAVARETLPALCRSLGRETDSLLDETADRVYWRRHATPEQIERLRQLRADLAHLTECLLAPATPGVTPDDDPDRRASWRLAPDAVDVKSVESVADNLAESVADNEG
jgi:hypothetical protein